MKTLRESLSYEPKILKFGTSGRRGLVVDLTQLEIYINAVAEMEYLQSLSMDEGGIRKGDIFFFAYDLRPSSTQYVPEADGRGEIAQAIERAIRDVGMKPINLGTIPSPAITYHATTRGKGSMMITGSHIPFDRNGYKTNTTHGELLKKDEEPIKHKVNVVRERLYHQPFQQSIFNEQGRFKSGHIDLSPVDDSGRLGYIQYYLDFFPKNGLQGIRVLVYQHSAVGRDILVDILRQLGAETVPAGRSDTFIPVDTENIDKEQLVVIQQLANNAWVKSGPLDAVVSTDGDSDRPLILGVEPDSPCRVRFYAGDLVGMLVAEYLDVDAVVVPINCNDAIDRSLLKDKLEPKTKIGSPHVIAGMEQARKKGKLRVCGWEATGGFLTGSNMPHNGKILKAIPTCDAVLPILCVLYSMVDQEKTLAQLFDQFAKRFSKASLLKHFPRTVSSKILARYLPDNSDVKEISFENRNILSLDYNHQSIPMSSFQLKSLQKIRSHLQNTFSHKLGFGEVIRINYVDGVRIYFSNGDIAHIRPSGNAPEMRIYAVADSQHRADAIVHHCVDHPKGILHRMKSEVEHEMSEQLALEN